MPGMQGTQAGEGDVLAVTCPAALLPLDTNIVMNCLTSQPGLAISAIWHWPQINLDPEQKAQVTPHATNIIWGNLSAAKMLSLSFLGNFHKMFKLENLEIVCLDEFL